LVEKDKRKWVKEMMDKLGVKAKGGDEAEVSEDDLMKVPLERIMANIKTGNYGRTGL
jgi:hypothetical protein